MKTVVHLLWKTRAVDLVHRDIGRQGKGGVHRHRTKDGVLFAIFSVDFQQFLS